jgi:hypothetical protein
VSVAHKPKSSAFVFVPTPQLMNQFVILDWCDLKKPPTPQQEPFDCAAPSKNAMMREASDYIGMFL